MSFDEILKAYATLGVRPGVSLARLRWRYRSIARKWHPDPVERAERMQAVDRAYRVLLRYLVIDDGQPPLPGARRARRSIEQQLAPAEIEQVWIALETDGPVDEVAATLDPPIIVDFLVREAYPQALIIGAFLALLCAGLSIGMWLNASPTMLVTLFVLLLALLHLVVWQRRRVKQREEDALPTPWH